MYKPNLYIQLLNLYAADSILLELQRGSFRLWKAHIKRDSLENILLPGFLPFLTSQISIKYYKILVFLSGNPTPLLHTRNLGIVQSV